MFSLLSDALNRTDIGPRALDSIHAVNPAQILPCYTPDFPRAQTHSLYILDIYLKGFLS